MVLVTVRRHLRGASAHFKLCAHLLDLPLQVSNGSLEIPLLLSNRRLIPSRRSELFFASFI